MNDIVNNQILFVYRTHSYLADSIFVGKARTINNSIAGELYIVTNSVLREIDYEEGWYTRRKISVKCRDQIYDAWGYEVEESNSGK